MLLPRLAARDAGTLVSGCAGQLVQHGDTPIGALPLVEAGMLEVVVHVDDEGRRVVPVWFGAGEVAMLSSLFIAETSAPPPRGDLVWRGGGRLRWLQRSAIEGALEAHPPLMALLARFLAQRLREVQQRERVWLERSVHERVRAVLARAVGEGADHLALTHEELAQRCGVSRPKLSAALKMLERAGVLRLHRGHIEMLRPESF